MNRMTIQPTSAANGYPSPQNMAQPPPSMPPGMQQQPPRPGYPPATGVPPNKQFSQPAVQPPPQQGQFAARPHAPVRPVNMRPAPPGQQPSRPLPGGYPAPNAGMMPGGPMPPGAPQSDSQTNKLSASKMPRPSALESPCGTPRSFYNRGMSLTSDPATFPAIPRANSDFISVDDGSSRLRFMRLTANSIASDPNVMSKSGIPLAVVMTPFADPVPGEVPVPIVDFTSQQIGGPLRCERCRGYANPGFKFLDGGSKFQCNLCTHMNPTPTEHYSAMSPATGLRMDADVRHELRFGSVDYLVGSKDYCIRPPKPACYFYAIDVSTTAVQSGLASTAMMSIKSALSAGLLPGSGQGARVAVMTFDRALHFFDARGAEEGKEITAHYVMDVKDPFVPLGGDALFLTPAQAVLAIDAAIENHGLGQQQGQGMQNGPQLSAESALGSALEAIKMAFEPCGGKAFVVAGSLPNAGVGILDRRGGGVAGVAEDREMDLLKAVNSKYEILGCELADVQASVDIFLAPHSVYIDAATISRVPRACGGRMHVFPSFDPIRDGASLHRSICVSSSEARAFESLIRVRTSPGLDAVGEYMGHFGRPQRGDDVAGPVLDASTTLALEISVTSKLLGDNRSANRPYSGSGSFYDDACVQCAVLFTDCAGRRRIRVHTIFASKTTVLADVFRYADVDATAAYLAKKASSAVLIGGTTFTKACEALTEKTAQTLYVYRKHCAEDSARGQLVLPEALKVLPVMMLGLLKSAAFRKSALSMQSGEAVTVDERAAALSFLLNGTVSEIAAMCYPRMWDILSIENAVGLPLPQPADPIVSSTMDPSVLKDANSREPIAMPNTLPLSAGSLTENGILLVENGMQMVVWLGSAVDKKEQEDVIAKVGGRLCIRAETAGSVALTKDISEKGKRVAKVIQRIATERRGLSRPFVAIRDAPGQGAEAKYVSPLLIEDRRSGTHSYVEYLRHIHKRVMDKMANDSAQSDMQTWEMLNHGY